MSKTIKIIILVLVIGIPVGIIIYLSTQSSNTIDQVGQTATTTVIATTTATDQTSQKYKDGTYSATGHYTSPAGPEQVPLTITLKDDVITDAQFVSIATAPTTQRFQGMFIANYKPLVIGKNIDDVILTKVSGSSLTPKGFNDALAQIKVEAQS